MCFQNYNLEHNLLKRHTPPYLRKQGSAANYVVNFQAYDIQYSRH